MFFSSSQWLNRPPPIVLAKVCVISMCVLILMAYSSQVGFQNLGGPHFASKNGQVLTDYKVDAGTTSPNDFAIMVKAGMVWDYIYNYIIYDMILAMQN